MLFAGRESFVVYLVHLGLIEVLALAGRNQLGLAATAALYPAVLEASFAVAHGWREDLVAARRAARRWVAMGIGLYAALALVIELALRGQAVGRLLPALHVAGIGVVALALAVVVARRSLDDILGTSLPGPAMAAVEA